MGELARRGLFRRSRTTTAGPPSLSVKEAFREHYDYIFRAVRSLGVPDERVDDAVQDVFVVLHRRKSDYDGRASVRTWLRGIARMVARKHLVAAAKEQRNREANDLPPDQSGHDIERRLLKQDAASAVQTFLDSLDEEQREIFYLVDIEGVRPPLIAEEMGVSVNTIYSRLRLARRKFKDFAAAASEAT